MKQVKQENNSFIRVIFVLYLMVLCYFLFFSERYGRSYTRQEYSYNLELFREINRFIKYRHVIGIESFVVNIFGNIFAFAPFGFLVPMIGKKRKTFFNVFLLSLELTLVIEVTQLLLRVGTFDVDDILMNTLGGMLGYVSYLFYRILKKGRTKNV